MVAVVVACRIQGGIMTEREVVETLLDSGITIQVYDRCADNKTRLFTHNGVLVTCYENGDYLVQGKNNSIVRDIVAVLKGGVAGEEETDITDFGGIIGVGV
jgi:hypothetical protein